MFAQDIVGRIGDEEIQAYMSYREDDPWAVTFAFSQGDTLVDWTFGRELLTEVFEGDSAGLGDVYLYRPDPETLIMSLMPNNPKVNMCVRFPAGEVVTFLEHTERMVPAGGEADLVDIDAEWIEWLNDV